MASISSLNHCFTNLDKVSKCLFADRTAEAAVHGVHAYMILQQFQLLKRFRAQDAGIGATVGVHQQMVLQGRVTDEALAADVAGKGVGVSAVHPQVLVQFVLVAEGLATVHAFKRTEALPDEKVLERCILVHIEEKAALPREPT